MQNIINDIISDYMYLEVLKISGKCSVCKIKIRQTDIILTSSQI